MDVTPKTANAEIAIYFLSPIIAAIEHQFHFSEMSFSN